MTRKSKLDRIRDAVLEVYAERKAAGALPMKVLSVMWDLHQRGIENTNPTTFEKAVTRILENEVKGADVAWETPEERKARRPDPVTKMIPCRKCDEPVAVPLDFKHPLGTSYDFYCKRPKCVKSRLRQERLNKKYQSDVAVSRVDPLDPESPQIKKIRAEWGVTTIIADRGKPKVPPPIEAVLVTSFRKQSNLTTRQVSAFLRIKGFADAFLPDEVRMYADHASGNYSKAEIEQRVIGRQYPSVHFDTNSSAIPFWDKMTMLENEIIIRHMKHNRAAWSIIDPGDIRVSDGPTKRNGHVLGAGALTPGSKEDDFSVTESGERRKAEVEDDLRRQGIVGRKARMAFFRS